jgi:threonine dehydratase
LNKILCLAEAERKKGIVAASTGNHGAAVAWALSRVGGRAIVYVTETAPSLKTKAIERWGAEVRRHGDDAVWTEAKAREIAAACGLIYVSPYNDPHVVAGQGTVAVEVARELEAVDAVFVPLGGGGLLSGVAGYLKTAAPETEVIGCSPENSQVMIQSVKAGRILDLPSESTLSDATAGGVEPGAITFDLCMRFVDSFVTVSEDEIKGAMLDFSRAEGMPIEGAAAVAVAAFRREENRLGGKDIVLIISGGNIDRASIKRIEREDV